MFKISQRFGYRLIPMAFVVPFLTTSDRFFLNQFVSLEQIAIYSIGYKFGMLINILLITPMQLAWIPMMYKMGLEEDSKKYYDNHEGKVGINNGDLLVLNTKDKQGQKYTLISFHGDTSGLATEGLIKTIDKIVNKKSILLIGQDANTYFDHISDPNKRYSVKDYVELLKSLKKN